VQPIPIIITARTVLTERSVARFINAFITQAKLHFLMIRTDYRLALALTLSLFFHALPFLDELLSRPPAKPSAPPPLQVSLKAPPTAQPQWIAPPPRQQAEAVKQPPRLVEPTKKSPYTTKPTPTWTDEVRRQFRKQHEHGDFYPVEAITQGLEGEVLVFAVIDSEGRVAAARVEQGSGFAILDQAALRAVRSLRSLPADAPRETLLPVRFRLK
jgi:periplasmic protein TonB